MLHKEGGRERYPNQNRSILREVFGDAQERYPGVLD